MPVDMSRYPNDWAEISLSVRNRANWQCECNGECGSHDGPCLALAGIPHPDTGSIVVLTVAHLGVPYPDGSPGDKHNKMDVRGENLKAMCQRCHLNYDRDEHALNAARTRYRRKIEAGQMELPINLLQSR